MFFESALADIGSWGVHFNCEYAHVFEIFFSTHSIFYYSAWTGVFWQRCGTTQSIVLPTSSRVNKTQEMTAIVTIDHACRDAGPAARVYIHFITRIFE